MPDDLYWQTVEKRMANAEHEKLMCRRVLRRIRGRLWHTTHPDRFKNILQTEAILPEPNLPDTDRWKTAQGPEFYPYVRTLGGVSLFDFAKFHAGRYSKKCSNSSWWEFVPYQSHWGASVWIEIDRELTAPKFISGTDLLARWNTEKKWQHSIMPYIEAAHVGPLPRAAFRGAFLVTDRDTTIRKLAI
jgi:hypothetical protein